MSEQNAERRVRRAAQRAGLKLAKSRVRNPELPGYGTFALVRETAPGWHWRSRELVADGLSLEEVAAWVADESGGTHGGSYAQRWADPINETYGDGPALDYFLQPDELLDGESYPDAEKRVLTKAARCLRNGVPRTFTAGELDLVRHRMPAHEVHQSGAVRWVLNTYGESLENNE